MEVPELSALKRRLVEEVLKFLSELGVKEIDKDLYEEIVDVCCELVETAFRYGALKRALSRLLAHAIAESLGEVEDDKLVEYSRALNSDSISLREIRSVLEMAMKLGASSY